MSDGVILLILAGVVAGAVSAIRAARKRGQRCIGCPHSGKCSGGCGHM